MEILGLVNIPIWAIILALVLFLYYRYMTRTYGVFTSMGVKGPSPWVISGHLHTFMWKGFNEANTDWFKKYGRIFGIHEGINPLLMVGDLDMLRDIVVKDFNNFPNRRDFGLRKMLKPPISDFLTLLEDDDWRHNRNWLTPTFSGGKLKKMAAVISSAGETLVANLQSKAESGEPINVKKFTGGYTMDVIASTAFGISVDSQNNPDDKFVENATELNNFTLFNPVLLLTFFFPFLVPLFGMMGVTTVSTKSMDFFEEVVKRLLSERRQQSEKSNDFLQMMVAAQKEAQSSAKHAHDDTENGFVESNDLTDGTSDGYWKDKRKGQGLTDGEIAAGAIIFFIAGYETTSTALSHALYHLSLNQDCTDKVIEEIDKYFPDDAVPDYDSVNKLPYLDMVLCETLRINPPIGRMDRKCSRETVVKGITIPVGMGVALPIYMIHHDPEYWPDPEKFDPERFTHEKRVKRHPLQWLPFGYGPRNCIGMRLAIVEMKILLVQLFQKYRFVPNEKTEIPLRFNETIMQTTGKRGIWLTVQNR